MKNSFFTLLTFLFLSQTAFAIRIPIPNSGQLIKAIPGVGHIVTKQECDEKNRSLDNRIDALDKHYAAASAHREQSQRRLDSVRIRIQQFNNQLQQSSAVLTDNNLILKQAQFFVSQIMEMRIRIEQLGEVDDHLLTNLLLYYGSLRPRFKEETRHKLDLLVENLRAEKKDHSEKLKMLKLFLFESGVQEEALAFVQSIQAQGANVDQTVKSTDALIQDMRNEEKELEKDIHSYDEQKRNLMNEMNALRGQHC